MEELSKLRSRPAFVAIAIGCVNGLTWAGYYALVKHVGAFEAVLAFLGGIPPVAIVAWFIITRYRARLALQKEFPTSGTPTEEIGAFASGSRIAVGCLAPIVSGFSGLLAGVGLLTSGAYRASGFIRIKSLSRS